MKSGVSAKSSSCDKAVATSSAMNCPRESLCVVTEEGSCLRLIDFCITQLRAQGPSRTCNESKEEEEECVREREVERQTCVRERWKV